MVAKQPGAQMAIARESLTTQWLLSLARVELVVELGQLLGPEENAARQRQVEGLVAHRGAVDHELVEVLGSSTADSTKMSDEIVVVGVIAAIVVGRERSRTLSVAVGSATKEAQAHELEQLDVERNAEAGTEQRGEYDLAVEQVLLLEVLRRTQQHLEVLQAIAVVPTIGAQTRQQRRLNGGDQALRLVGVAREHARLIDQERQRLVEVGRTLDVAHDGCEIHGHQLTEGPSRTHRHRSVVGGSEGCACA